MIRKHIRYFLFVVLLSATAIHPAEEGLADYLNIFVRSFVTSAAWRTGSNAANYLFREHRTATLIGATAIVAGVIVYKEIQRKNAEHHEKNCWPFMCKCKK